HVSGDDEADGEAFRHQSKPLCGRPGGQGSDVRGSAAQMGEMSLELLKLPLFFRIVVRDGKFDLLAWRIAQQDAPRADETHGLLEEEKTLPGVRRVPDVIGHRITLN